MELKTQIEQLVTKLEGLTTSVNTIIENKGENITQTEAVDEATEAINATKKEVLEVQEKFESFITLANEEHAINKADLTKAELTLEGFGDKISSLEATIKTQQEYTEKIEKNVVSQKVHFDKIVETTEALRKYTLTLEDVIDELVAVGKKSINTNEGFRA